MGEIKVSLAKEAEVQDKKASSTTILSQLNSPESKNPEDTTLVINQSIPTGIKKETMTAVIKPNGSTEIKAKMSKGDIITYSWKAE